MQSMIRFNRLLQLIILYLKVGLVLIMMYRPRFYMQ